MRKHVYNAGRYNGTGSEVHVDFVSQYVTYLDQASSAFMLQASEDVEAYIDA